MPVLFTIECQEFELVWSRRRDVSVPACEGRRTPASHVRLPALNEEDEPRLWLHTSSDHRLFEQTDYTLLVRSRQGARLSVRHRDPVLVANLHASHDQQVVHGTINFGTQVGWSRFAVLVDGRPKVTFEVEVFPTKLEYRQDYRALRSEVQEVSREIVVEFLRATYETAGEDAREPSGTMSWVLLLRRAVDELEQSLHHVARHPLRDTVPAVVEQRAHCIRRPDAALRRSLRKAVAQRAACILPEALPVPERLPGTRGRYTLDTPEHRWLSAQLASLRRRLAATIQDERHRRPGSRRREIIRELASLHQRIERLMRLDFLPSRPPSVPPEPTQRMQRSPGYHEAYRACTCLRHGLVLEGDALDTSMKELHVLYEYWCFLTLVRLAAGLTGRRESLRDLVAVERRGLRLQLRKGRTQRITFELGAERRLVLTYNPRFSGPNYLVPQQPDVLLSVYDGSRCSYRAVLDAKYRLDDSPAYRRQYGVPGPPTDALNQLHRYRDALRVGYETNEDAVTHAVALFPFRENTPGSWNRSRHCRTLTTIGAGAIPLLPGGTEHLATWLAAVVDGSAVQPDQDHRHTSR